MGSIIIEIELTNGVCISVKNMQLSNYSVTQSPGKCTLSWNCIVYI